MSRSLRFVSAGLGALFSPLVLAVSPFVVKDIRVQGVLRTEAGTVFNYLPIKVGDKVDDQAVSRAIKSLFATGFFSDVRIEVDKEVLVVIVDERPAIAKISFSGNDAFDSKNLLQGLKDIGIVEAQTFDRSQLEKAEQEIKRLYLTRGFYGVTVKTTISPMERNRVAINFEVIEGQEAKIKSIRILGTKAFKESKILGVMSLEKAGRWYDFFADDKYSRQKLQGDIEEIKSWYLDRGYINFKVDSSQVSITPDKKDVYISLSVTEGDLYHVSTVKLAGDLLVPERELREIVSLKRGDVYSRSKVNEISRKLADRLGHGGYAFANVNVSPEIDDKKKEVGLTFFVDPGRRFYVNRINVLGNSRTQDVVIRREILQFENAWFDRQLLDESKKRIERTGFFDEVTIETVPVAGAADQIDLNIKVKEHPTGSINGGIGYSQSEGVMINGSISQKNLFGTGKSLSLGVNTSSIGRMANVSYDNPYWTTDGVSRGFDLYRKTTDYKNAAVEKKYATTSLGTGVRFGVPISVSDAVHLGFGVDRTKVSIDNDSPQKYKDFVEEFGDLNTSLMSSIGWSRDSRNSALAPTSGTKQRANFEVALPPGEMRYSRLSYEFQKYFFLDVGYTLMAHGEFGAVQGYGGKSVPFYKYFYAGGIGSLRGFKDGSLGARVYDDAGNPTDEIMGGTRRMLGGLELFVPVPGTKEKNSAFRMSTFVDAGSIWGGGSAQDPYAHAKDIRASVGLAFTWFSPMGPLAISYAAPILKKPGDKTQPLQFQIGSVF